MNGTTFVLSSDQDVAVLQQQFEGASHSPGRFVRFTATGGRETSVLVSFGTQVVFSTWTAHVGVDDTAEATLSFPNEFDY